MEENRYNIVKDWKLRVFEQSIIETKSGKMVKMKTTKSGKKIEGEDNKWEDPMFIDVLLNKDTKWAEADLSRTNVLVSGSFAHSTYKKQDGTTGLNFTIFADEVKELS